MDWPFGKMSQSEVTDQAQAIRSLDLEPYGGSKLEEIELKRFFLLRHELGRPIRVRSRRLSELWRRFMFDEQLYTPFCVYTFGHYLEFECGNGERDWEFYRMYDDKFGSASSDIWEGENRGSSEHFD